MENIYTTRTDEFIKLIKAEEERLKGVLEADAADVAELKSEWQERDSPSENIIRTVEWEQYSSIHDELTALLDARQRLREGTFGICAECEEPIPEKRMRAVLTARKCIACQEFDEKDVAERATL